MIKSYKKFDILIIFFETDQTISYIMRWRIGLVGGEVDLRALKDGWCLSIWC